MTLEQGAILLAAALVGGILNAVAGGGTFVVFPALIVTGMPAIAANATTTTALWPGTMASVGAYRDDLTAQHRGLILALALASALGAIVGAILLLGTPQATFTQLVPWLLLVATVLFIAGGPMVARLRARAERRATARAARGADGETAAGDGQFAAGRDAARSLTWPRLVGVGVFQFAIAIYGGYFGGGIGIVILAMLGLIGLENINTMNGIRTLMASCVNAVAIITFAIAGIIVWSVALLMLGGAIVGGYGGAHVARKIDPVLVRRIVALIGIAMTTYFFVRTYDLITVFDGWLQTLGVPI